MPYSSLAQEMDWKHSSGLKIPKKQCVKEQNNFVQALYDTESPEIKESVKLECTRLFDEAVKLWEEEHNANHSPKAIQRCSAHFFPLRSKAEP
jgi:hypothetical protein